MHDDKSWLKRPILPRPPALPQFGPEMRALIGLDPSDLERDVAGSEPNAAHVEPGELDSNRDTEPDALASKSKVQVPARARLIRSGT